MRWLLSFLHIAQAYAMMAVMAVVFLPWAMVSAQGARTACRTWAHWAMWTSRVMLGLRTEIRGPVPEGACMVAAKHQSFLDILMIYAVLPRPRFIMKRELLWTPIIGQYAYRLGCIPVARGRRAEAIRKMVEDVRRGAAEPGQLVIYPQGTRVPPGVVAPYKVGAAVLYEELDQPCHPVATNAGVFWPRKGILKRPGTAVVTFLAPLPAGLDREGVLTTLEARIEPASEALLDEARRPDIVGGGRA
ncbi:MAG: lysophospholipid acyltransferase family protein [Shimia sp.]